MPDTALRSPRCHLRLALVANALAIALPATAQEAPRSVVPIREVVIRPAGTPRYAVTIVVNGVPIETGLDTGSIGLRILPRAVAHAGVVAEAQTVRYSYGSGVQLDGHRATVDLAIGAARGRVPVQAIERVSCANGGSCPASRVPPAAYGLMGSGRPGQGFQAIMGTRLNGGDIPNPLTAMGIRRWIVHLPARGGRGGVLILNPDAHDVAGFVSLRHGAGEPGTVAGCAMIARPDARRFCGPTLLDTGESGLHIRGAARPPGWQRGLPARLVLPSAAGDGAPTVAFRTGDEPDGAETQFQPGRGTGLSLNAGTLPFYAYDVLFDQQRDSIAVRPNQSSNGTVRAER